MNLKNLNRTELDQKIKSLSLKERELLSEILLVIKEIDGRRLYLEMGFGSLFSYLVEGVGYSEGAAQRRIDAARLLKEIPFLVEKIESGSVNLSQISLMQKNLREMKKQAQHVSTEDKIILLEKISHKTYQETQKEIAAFLDLPIHKAEIKSTQADESVRVTLTLSKRLHDRINWAQELISHSLPNKELVAYLEFVTDTIIKQKTELKAKKSSASNSNLATNNNKCSMKHFSQQADLADKEASTFCNHMNELPTIDTDAAAQSVHTTCDQVVEQPLADIPALSAPIPQKHISNLPMTAADVAAKNVSARVRKELLKTQSHCQYKDPVTGKACQSTWHLQIDHIHSRWVGGSNEPENLQILCRAHNIYKYKTEMNIKHIGS